MKKERLRVVSGAKRASSTYTMCISDAVIGVAYGGPLCSTNVALSSSSLAMTGYDPTGYHPVKDYIAAGAFAAEPSSANPSNVRSGNSPRCNAERWHDAEIPT